MDDLQLDPTVVINAASDTAAADYRAALSERALLKAQVVALTAKVRELEQQLPSDEAQQG